MFKRAVSGFAAMAAVAAVMFGAGKSHAMTELEQPIDEGGGSGSGGNGGYVHAYNPHAFTLYVHGRNGTASAAGNWGNFSYWGSMPYGDSGGMNPRAVNWCADAADCHNSISMTNSSVRRGLDRYCTGQNWCAIATHSAGAAQVGYALAHYGASSRAVEDGNGNFQGYFQNGWNIKFIDAAGGAEGGSEMAEGMGFYEPLVYDLDVSRMRSMWDHNINRGITWNMFAGANGSAAWSQTLPGEDDQMVAYHSSGGVSGSSGGNYNNPNSWGRTVLTWNYDWVEGRAKWAGHRLVYRDDGQNHTHFTNGSWSNIVSKLPPHMRDWSY